MPDFNQILSSMIGHLRESKSKLSDFTPTSVTFQIFSAVASVIDQIYFSIESAKKQAYVTTATEKGLDAKGKDLGVPRKEATPARWTFTFSKNQPALQKIEIPKDTVISTIPHPGLEPIVFLTTEDTFLPYGTQEVTVPAVCKKAGSAGNIPVGSQLLIGSSLVGIDRVELRSTDNGLYATDTETDEAYRMRLLGALASKAQGTVAWYEQEAMAVPGVQFARVVPQGRGPGTVDVYIVPSSKDIPLQELIEEVTDRIDAGRIITDDAKVFGPTLSYVNLTVNIQVAPEYAGADEEQTVDAELTAELEGSPQGSVKIEDKVRQALEEYINSLGIGGGPYGTFFHARAQAVALSVPGVLNVVPVTPPPEDITFKPQQLPQAGIITVNRV